MDFRFSDEEEAFRAEVRGWLQAALAGPFGELCGRGGPGDELFAVEERRAWERHLGAAGWVGLGWPRAHGGRGASLIEQLLFHEEYARALAPGRLGHIGEQLVAPTLLACGSDEQRRRFLPRIRSGDELWCQGYSEPAAGSDLANLQTRAVRRGDAWEITGQKIWTSHAHLADWCLLLARTDPARPRHRGISCLLMPMRQPGVTVTPIAQLTGGSEFSTVFLDGARTGVENVVGELHGGWSVAMSTLAVERGVSTLGQLIGFHNELDAVIARAKENGAARDPLLRQRLAEAWMRLRVLRLNALRALAPPSPSSSSGMEEDGMAAAAIHKLAWSTWHQELGKLAMDVLGAESEIVDGGLSALQRMFLFSRADTIYAGTSEIQRTILGERVLGLPPEPRP